MPIISAKLLIPTSSPFREAIFSLWLFPRKSNAVGSFDFKRFNYGSYSQAVGHVPTAMGEQGAARSAQDSNEGRM